MSRGRAPHEPDPPEPDGHGADPFLYVGAVLAGFQHAAPEVTEHLARAAYEVLLAGRAVVEGLSEALAEAEGRERRPGIETIPVRRTS